ncbi:unnamed protein product, partial [Owenia fusiformis]
YHYEFTVIPIENEKLTGLVQLNMYTYVIQVENGILMLFQLKMLWGKVQPPVKVPLSDLEIRPFDKERDNWREVKQLAFITYTETNPKMVKAWLSKPWKLGAILLVSSLLFLSGYMLISLVFLIGAWLLAFAILMKHLNNKFTHKQKDYNNFVNYWTTDPRRCLWVAFHNGTLVGTVGVQENEDKTKGELVRMSVNNNYRRNGIAEALVNVLLKWCEENNYKQIHLGTTEYQPGAVKFYFKMHFEMFGTIEYFMGPKILDFRVLVHLFSLNLPRDNITEQ